MDRARVLMVALWGGVAGLLAVAGGFGGRAQASSSARVASEGNRLTNALVGSRLSDVSPGTAGWNILIAVGVVLTLVAVAAGVWLFLNPVTAAVEPENG